MMCPHCGELMDCDHLTPFHNWPKLTRQVCPGSQQIPRCAESDARPLWNGEPNPHFDVARYAKAVTQAQAEREMGFLTAASPREQTQ